MTSRLCYTWNKHFNFCRVFSRILAKLQKSSNNMIALNQLNEFDVYYKIQLNILDGHSMRGSRRCLRFVAPLSSVKPVNS